MTGLPSITRGLISIRSVIVMAVLVELGAPGRTRTCGHRLRSAAFSAASHPIRPFFLSIQTTLSVFD
jgi:hypothetical protein